jgi:hypothetical protein
MTTINWGNLAPERDLQPTFYKPDVTLGRTESFYKNRMVTEPMIIALVGLETYKALNFRWPELYWPVNRNMIPSKSYLDLVDSIASSSQIEMTDFGRIIKIDLVRMTIDGGDNQGVSGILVSSSLSVRHFDIPFKDQVFFIVWCIIWTLVTVYVLCKMRLAESLLYPKMTSRISFSLFT